MKWLLGMAQSHIIPTNCDLFLACHGFKHDHDRANAVPNTIGDTLLY